MLTHSEPSPHSLPGPTSATPTMPLRVYNTLSQTKEPFETVQPGKVGMYVCGPTVYKPSHIGHMVGPVIFDTIKRYLAYCGYEVTLGVNITDVDDKLIVRVRRTRHDHVRSWPSEMTADYLDCLEAHGRRHGIDHMPRATEHIAEIIAITQALIDKGFAYAVRRRRLLRRGQGRRLRQAQPPRPGGAARRGRGSRSAIASATPATSPCGKAPSRASRRGRAPGARAGPAGTSNARP